MNYLRKKLKPLNLGTNYNISTRTTGGGGGVGGSRSSGSGRREQNLEDDLYDEYVVEAPPHPSELLALGVDPLAIDVNDPEKLRELYRKAKEAGKCSSANSILLAKQRQKEEIEEKKKTREEWKFFDSLTARVEEAVKESKKTLEQLKESSAIDKLNQPDYELVLTPDEVFKSSASIKREKSINSWINFSEEETGSTRQLQLEEKTGAIPENERLDGEAHQETSGPVESLVAEELLQDFGIDLRPAEQRKAAPARVEQPQQLAHQDTRSSPEQPSAEFKSRARPRPKAGGRTEESESSEKAVDPFDTSFVSPGACEAKQKEKEEEEEEEEEVSRLTGGNSVEASKAPAPKPNDPFDTSYVNL